MSHRFSKSAHGLPLRVLAPFLLLVPFLAACSSETSNGSPPGITVPEGDELYVVAVGVQSPDNQSVYLAATSSLDEGVIDIRDTIEVTGSGRGFAIPGAYLYWSRETNIMTRYEVSAEGALVAAGRLSFAATGGNPQYAHLMLSERELLLPDLEHRLLFVVDPIDMVITRSETIDGLGFEGFNIDGEQLFEIEPGKYAMPVWMTDYTNIRINNQASAMVILDLGQEGETEWRIAGADGCAGTYLSFQTDDGDVYAANDQWTLYFHWLSDQEPSVSHSCAMRIAAGTDTFAPDQVDLQTVADGRLAGNLSYAGDTMAYFIAHYPEQLPDEADEDVVLRLTEPAWRVWRMDLETRVGEAVAEIPFVASAYPHYVDGRLYMRTESQGQQTLWRMGPDGSVSKGLTMPGFFVYNVGRIL